jgi:RNA polymerase sigma factor (sigma-70 family)
VRRCLARRRTDRLPGKADATEGGAEVPYRGAEAHERRLFVLDNDRLACALAQKFRWCGEDIEDLQQVAREALIVAALRFDPGHGVRFSTYAYRVIWGRLMRHIRDDVRLIKHPRRAHMAGRPYLRIVSLDALLECEGSAVTLEGALGVLDRGFDAVERRLTAQTKASETK